MMLSRETVLWCLLLLPLEAFSPNWMNHRRFAFFPLFPISSSTFAVLLNRVFMMCITLRKMNEWLKWIKIFLRKWIPKIVKIKDVCFWKCLPCAVRIPAGRRNGKLRVVTLDRAIFASLTIWKFECAQNRSWQKLLVHQMNRNVG